MPVNSCLLSTSKESNLIGPTKTYDQRTIAGKRRKLAQMKAPDAMIRLLKEALCAGHTADYVLFDCWFANPAQITAAKSMGLAFVCTNPELSEEEIIRIYGKRWQVEVFFKTCKSTLNLIGECHSLSYDALTAHVAIVFTRYMLLSLEQRKSDDQRTLGQIFYFLVDEMADISFAHSLNILMEALLASLQEILKLSDVQVEAFTADFVSRLPKHLQNALKPGISVA